MTEILADAMERLQAATTFDRNVVVTAGAGTGKTTLLVQRLIHLLMREPSPVKVTELVALTFTNKAADEMKVRLRQRLEAYVAVRLDQAPANAGTADVHREVGELLRRYHLRKQEIDTRAKEALRHVERSEVGTIHSFAASLLRLYPMEAGLDPQFREDDGKEFDRHFEQRWDLWLDRELAHRAPRAELWKKALRRLPLDLIRRLACALSPETVDLNRLTGLVRSGEDLELHRSELKALIEKATRLMTMHPENRAIEQHVKASRRLLQEWIRRGALEPGTLDVERTLLASGKSFSAPKGWSSEEVEEARTLVRVATRVMNLDGEFSGLLCTLLVPFVEEFRDHFARVGFVSFDGLLVRACRLLREHGDIREELKGRFKAILVDEFQDTDPVQYEVLLYLAEVNGRQSGDWRKIELEPGKLFVVGDPKQSIYAFRRADIEAYLGVVRDVVVKQKGLECTLKTSFRSPASVLDPVNDIFSRLIQARPALQPPYAPIYPLRESGDEALATSQLRGVEIRCVESDEDLDADDARRLEGESLARWLSEEVLEKAVILDKDGSTIPIRAGHVAILLRSLVNVEPYLEPLRGRGIPYVVEGEKHFYATQEVIDVVNLLRTVDNPYDRLALAGVLRSPLGGLDDGELYELHRRGFLDYRRIVGSEGDPHSSPLAHVRELYTRLDRLHRETRRLPVGEAVGSIFDSLPVAALAASSYHGEQKVANLEKVRLLAQEMGREGTATLKGIIATLQGRVSEIPDEGESSLAEEGLNAIRILSVHKAKGLEFPVVILAGCQAGVNRRAAEPVEVYHDWSTGRVGLHLEDLWSLSGVFLDEKKRAREEEEQRRVFYVAATRAREHLTLSYAATKRGSSGSFIALTEKAMGEIGSTQDTRWLPAGNGRIHLKVLKGTLEAPESHGRKPETGGGTFDWRGYAAELQQRKARYREAVETPSFVNPTLLKQREEEGRSFAGRRGDGGHGGLEARLLGELTHEFLYRWDFNGVPTDFRLHLSRFLSERLEALPGLDPATVSRELEGILDAFFPSVAYRDLQEARILGREIPFLLPWGDQVMEGVLDLLYEKDGRLYVADYKTDRVLEKDLPRVVASYHHQAEIYREAARRSLQREVSGLKFYFLRLGRAVTA